MTALAIQNQHIAFYSERLLSKPLNMASVKRDLIRARAAKMVEFDVDILLADRGVFLTVAGRE